MINLLHITILCVSVTVIFSPLLILSGVLSTFRTVISRKTAFSIYAAILVLIGALLFVRFAPPNNKRLYIFQAYTWPKYPSGIIPPPSGYTGEWKQWHENGVLRGRGWIVNGKDHRKWEAWDENGRKICEANHVNGIIHGKFKAWHYTKRVMVEMDFTNGIINGKRVKYSLKDKTVIQEKTFINGKCVSVTDNQETTKPSEK